MVKMKKAGKPNFITKGKAMKRLQLSPREFQRMCILKGIYPIEPKKKHDNKIYYSIKDIKFLASERLIDQFRRINAHIKKINKYKLRQDEAAVKKLTECKPDYSLHHLVKERYPSFLDAVRDLDDALSLICLFASCPSNKDIPNEVIRTSEKIWEEFELILMGSHSLRKAFLSIKGIYYQAEIHGQVVTWLVPYQFTQNLPADIDYTIMTSYLEFYHTLLKFVMFRLYRDIALTYPPDLSSGVANVLAQSSFAEPEIQIEEEFRESEEFKELLARTDQERKIRNLFSGLVFLLGRETPRYSLELIIRSSNGIIVNEDCPEVTHQVVDRPVEELLPSREYIQPQWLFDSLNFQILLPVTAYAPSSPLPPHLSPFEDYQKTGHIPDRLKEIKALKGESLKPVDPDEKLTEEQELGKMLMPRKMKNLYQRMQYGLKEKRSKRDKIKSKKAADKGDGDQEQ